MNAQKYNPDVLTCLANLNNDEVFQNGCEYAVIEASSHGLSVKTNRLGDIPFDAAAMMNVNHEHLEFHGTYEQYKSDKANLFRNLAQHAHEKVILNAERTIEPVAVVNAADPAAQYFVQAASGIPVAGFTPQEQYADDSDGDFMLKNSSGDFQPRSMQGNASVDLSDAKNIASAIRTALNNET